jgi:arylsulfatase A-like enzyme
MIPDAHRNLAREVDQGIGALLTDLKRLGLLEDTLVVCGGEFGRTPAVEMPAPGTPGNGKGRDHNHHGFSVWLAGGGVKGGMTYGKSDEFGFAAAENKMHVHDLHATILHQLGIDHTKLTVRAQGRDFRLTDVAGKVVPPLLA